jgi:hypothetical protein
MQKIGWRNNFLKICCFLWPLTTGDVWWQDGQIKEEEEEGIIQYSITINIG